MAVWGKPTAAARAGAQPTLFLDRDGVVIRDRDYLAHPSGVEVLPGAAEAMIAARQAGFQIIGVSNQSGIGRGYFGLSQLDAVMKKLVADLGSAGAGWDGFYYCPHAPGARCACRKPLPGLLDEAAADFAWDPQLSWVVGDKASDVELGLAAGLGAVLVRTGYGANQESDVVARWSTTPRLLIADDLQQAVSAILARAEFSGREEGS